MNRSVWILIGCALALQSQTQTAGPDFEAASVRLADHTFGRGTTFKTSGGPGTSDPGRVTYSQMRLIDLISGAWDLEEFRVSGPAWISGMSDLYTITATCSPGTTLQQLHLMMQRLLIARFGLKLRHEMKAYPGYELVVSEGGPKLKGTSGADVASTGSEARPIQAAHEFDTAGFLVLRPGHAHGSVTRAGGTYAKYQSYTIDEFINPDLRNFAARASGGFICHIENKTGLTGRYDFTLKFQASDEAAFVARSASGGVAGDLESNAPTGGGSLSSLFKAIDQQLGLKLAKRRFMLDTIVVESAAKVPKE